MALIDEQNKINEMYRKIPDQSDAAAANIGQVEDVREELAEQATAIEDAVLAVAEADLTVYLDTIKLAEISALYPPVPLVWGPVYIVYGGDYGTINYNNGNITDWEYLQDSLVVPIPPAPPTPPVVRYVYTPGDDPQIDTWVNDYAYGNDYLTKPLSTSGTYGIYENINQLDTGLNVLNANKTALDGGEDVFSRYLP